MDDKILIELIIKRKLKNLELVEKLCKPINDNESDELISEAQKLNLELQKLYSELKED